MCAKVTEDLRTAILSQYRLGTSHRKIAERVSTAQKTISYATVQKVTEDCESADENALKPPKKKRNQHLKKLSPRKALKRLQTLATQDNPLPQRRMAKLLGVSQRTLRKTIDEDLDMVKARKGKVQPLSDKMVAQRMARAVPLYNFIRGTETQVYCVNR